MAASVEVPTRKLDARVVTTHSKDRPDVQPVETLQGKSGELRLGIPVEMIRLSSLVGTSLRTRPDVHVDWSQNENSCAMVSKCRSCNNETCNDSCQPCNK